MKVDLQEVSVPEEEAVLYKDVPKGVCFRVIDVGQKKTPTAIYMKVGPRRELKRQTGHESAAMQVWPTENHGDVYPPFPDDREVVQVIGIIILHNPIG